ncbi:MAG: hypothetical protein MZV63_13245 [Marinilabiliales bacterium]|nr:hypothetical protein [Marinilabiliales bacterium]
MRSQENGFTPHIKRQFHVGDPVSDHEALRQVIVTLEISGQHPGPGFPGRSIVFRHAAVDVDVPE